LGAQPLDPAAPATGPSATPTEPDLLVSHAATGRALAGEFDPRAFVDDLSAQLRPLVPHDRMGILYLAEDRRTFSMFAEHGVPGLLPHADRYTTDLNRAARFRVADSPLCPVFDGESLRVPDLLADPRFVADAAQARPAVIRSAVLVPLAAGSRVTGALIAASATAGLHEDVHLERLRGIGRLIGPFIEIIVLLYRERRRRHRLGLLRGITYALGTTLDVREILTPLADAIRPALDFDAMGMALLTLGGREFVLFGRVGGASDANAGRIYLKDCSFAETLEAGRPALVHDAVSELDRACAGDRALLASGLQSLVTVPMRFGDEIGGALFFAKRDAYWYDEVDADVATAVASQMVLGIQHQRLAEEQRRLASVERRARTLEQSLKSARSELH
jgi:GAF domain-containing protein